MLLLSAFKTQVSLTGSSLYSQLMISKAVDFIVLVVKPRPLHLQNTLFIH